MRDPWGEKNKKLVKLFPVFFVEKKRRECWSSANQVSNSIAVAALLNLSGSEDSHRDPYQKV
jgi:hypothetical protein